jgi:A/G-specific adenine glycosylase
MESIQLPFGRTRISSEELEDLIEVETATARLEAGGVSNSRTRVLSFVDELPALLFWLEQNGREYPWRFTTDPWRVYISEILLQRTRGDAVAEVYDTFFERFPNAEALYRADDDEIFEVVSSLGFGNQRTRTLEDVGELCHTEYEGAVPRKQEELKRPWRVGPYSARACLLFAFGEPQPLVDANIARIVERVFDYGMPTQPHKSSEVYELVGSLLPQRVNVARAFTLALLDLGDSICISSNPKCSECPLSSCCAYANS